MIYWKVNENSRNRFHDFIYVDVPCWNKSDGCEDTVRIRYHQDETYEEPRHLLCKKCMKSGPPQDRLHTKGNGISLSRQSGLGQDMGAFDSGFDVTSIVACNVNVTHRLF